MHRILSAPQKDDGLQQSSTDELASPNESLQIEQAYVMEETLLSQQIIQQCDSLDPLMSSTQIKTESSERQCSSYENSVFIIDESPEIPITIEDSFLIGQDSQTPDTEESIIGKAEREACKRLDELQYEL